MKPLGSCQLPKPGNRVFLDPGSQVHRQCLFFPCPPPPLAKAPLQCQEPIQAGVDSEPCLLYPSPWPGPHCLPIVPLSSPPVIARPSQGSRTFLLPHTSCTPSLTRCWVSRSSRVGSHSFSHLPRSNLYVFKKGNLKSELHF